MIRELKERGVAILFISHFLDQVYEICDRITVLRDGELVGEYLPTDLLRIELVQKMLGHDAPAMLARDRGPDRRRRQSDVYLSGTRRDVDLCGIIDADVDLGGGRRPGCGGTAWVPVARPSRAPSPGVDRLDAGAIRIEDDPPS